MSQSNQKRMDKDVMKLIESGYEVIILNDLNEFIVKFHGPKATPYEGGIWKIRVFLPENYPFKSPSIGFINKIFHPNIEESSGTVCLDVINQSWTPLYDLVNIFEIFLPQLLNYPNSADPLNRRAAIMCLEDPENFRKEIIEYVKKYASDIINKSSGILEEQHKKSLEENEKSRPIATEDNCSESSVSDLSVIEEDN